jgi:hypothetical protein
MRLCGVNLEILYARLKNSFARNFPGDAQLQQFLRTNRMSCWPKNYFPVGFLTAQPKKMLRARIFGV